MSAYIQQLQAYERRRKRVISLASKGTKQREIARRLNITPQRVSQIIAASREVK